MPIVIKTSATYKRFLRFAREARKQAVNKIASKFPAETLDLLKDGISPTQGGKFKNTYSESYIKLIGDGKYPGKTISPVNLRLHGKLYNSLRTRKLIRLGIVTLRFADVKAAGHDKGLGHLPVRRLFPESDEVLHVNLRNIVARSTEDAVLKLAKLSSDR